MIENLDSQPQSRESLILHWRNDPVQAAKDIFDVDLDKHQRIVLRSRWVASTEIDIFTRGGGKTFMNGLCAGLRGVLYPGHRIGLIGPSFRQSKLMFAELERLYEASPIFQQACAKSPVRTPDSCYIKFASAPGTSGSFIEALPLGTDGAKIRGNRYYELYADEISQIEEDCLDVVARGFLATSKNPMERVRFMAEQREKIRRGEMSESDLITPEQNKLIMSGTAFFQYNHLWRRVQSIIESVTKDQRDLQRAGKPHNHIKILGGPLNGGQIPARWITDGKLAVTAFTYKDLSEGFMNLQTIQDAKRDMSDYLFRMEYEAYFPPDSEGFYRRSLLDAARKHSSFSCQAGPRKGMIYAMGVDPARTSDNFAIAIFEIDPENQVCHLVRVYTWNKKSFPEMHIHVRRLIQHWGIKLIKMDAGGGGTTIRDLLADKTSCPIGQRLILERENEDHMRLVGDKLLAPLVQFSSADWVHDSNHNLLSALQHGQLLIASIPPVGGELWTQEKEDADEELEKALVEWSSIIVTVVGNRQRWDTPTKTQRKDRYSAILLGYDAARELLATMRKPQRLAVGSWY